MPEKPTTDHSGSVTQLVVDPTDAERVRRWCAAVTGSPYGDAYPAYAREVRRVAGGLPSALTGVVAAFGQRLGEAGALVVRGLPVPAGLPATPSTPYAGIRRTVGTEPLLLALAGLLGDVIGFADWHGGDRIQNMYPVRSQAAAQNANNSVYLEVHTETAFRPDTPHALMLLCLRTDDVAHTLYGDLHQPWVDLDADDRDALLEPRFAFRTAEGALTEPKPVAVAGAGPVRFNFAEALVGVDATSVTVLDRLRARILAGLRHVTLAAGDLLLLDNLHMVHGRAAFTPRYDGTDRWLQRCLVRTATVTDARRRA